MSEQGWREFLAADRDGLMISSESPTPADEAVDAGICTPGGNGSVQGRREVTLTWTNSMTGSAG
jgi:hypothetical protein